ncbi:SRPBCC family protein [Dyadobacter sp. CY326]|uniref:SRPBCC family protein n=1 Tax=Dyadobacter sp. CY326 TaxID=2907300 RepID=UPI001F3C238A|nr:SRPBCC family protein [Dyadobacter sp. CY326]MCE7064800.1 SRPBCC family protein [Dyadobacter sp. CY326]
MRVVFIILIALVSIVVLLLIVAAFVKKEYEVRREILINQPSRAVFDYVRHVKNQDNYSVWVMADPKMKKDYSGVDGQVGFVYAWDSQDGKVGKGHQEITAIKEAEEVDLKVTFIKPFEGVGLTEMKTEPAGDGQTRVSWGMRGKSVYPMNITNLFIDGILGKDLEKSLINLRTVLEK